MKPGAVNLVEAPRSPNSGKNFQMAGLKIKKKKNDSNTNNNCKGLESVVKLKLLLFA